MPILEEWCEVRTTSGIYRDWTSVSVRYSMEENWHRFFQLELAEVTPTGVVRGAAQGPSLLDQGGAGRAILQRLKPGDIVDIVLAGQKVIENGYIKTRQSASEANRHAVQVHGMSAAGRIREVSIDPKKAGGGQFRNQNITQIANKALRAAGVRVNFRLENAPAGADRPFPNIILHDNETPWDLIQRLARNRTVWVQVVKNGDLVGGDGPKSGGVTLAEGVNIESISVFLEWPWAAEAIGVAQKTANNNSWGTDATEIEATAKVPDGDPGKEVRVHAEEPADKSELKMRANMESRAISASTLRANVTYRGWLKPGFKTLWENLGENVTVISPTHFPWAPGGRVTLRLWGVTYSQDNARATITVVELVSENAFSQTYPDSTKPGPFQAPE